MTSAPTGALLDTCFRQVEYAGVLAGAANPAARAAGRGLPAVAGVPGRAAGVDVRVPGGHGHPAAADWAKYAQVATDPVTLDPQQIADNRDAWIEQWTDLMG